MISNCCQQINTNAFIDHDDDGEDGDDDHDDHDDEDDPRSSASAAMQMWTKQTNNSTSTNLGHPAQPNYFVACDGNPCKVFKDLIIFQNLLFGRDSYKVFLIWVIMVFQ